MHLPVGGLVFDNPIFLIDAPCNSLLSTRAFEHSRVESVATFIDPFLVLELGRIEVNRCIARVVIKEHFESHSTKFIVLLDVVLIRAEFIKGP